MEKDYIYLANLVQQLANARANNDLKKAKRI